MTLTTLIAQLREKAAKAEAAWLNGCRTDAECDAVEQFDDIADPTNLTALLDILEAMRDALTCTATWSQPGKTCPDTAIHRGAWCKACLVLARFDAELGSKP